MTEFSRSPRNIEHVRQPHGSKSCFAACIASALGMDGTNIPAIDQALAESYLLDDAGRTMPPWEPTRARTEPTDPGFRLETTYGLEEQSPEGAYGAISESLANGERIALLHQETTDPADGMHWVLLADGQLMDPLAATLAPLEDRTIRDMIARSTDGVYIVSIQN